MKMKKLMMVAGLMGGAALSTSAWSAHGTGRGAGSCNATFTIPGGGTFPMSVDCPRQHYIEGYIVDCDCGFVDAGANARVSCSRDHDGNKLRESESKIANPFPPNTAVTGCTFEETPLDV